MIWELPLLKSTKAAKATGAPVPILMVDDRPENLIALRAILDGNNYEISQASDGNEALLLLLRNEFAVILLDVMMPGMDGYEVAAMIRAREASRHTPIIFLTAIATDHDHMLRGYAIGAADYLTKPLEPAIVQAKVTVFAELYQKSRQLLAQEARLREQEARIRLMDLVQTIPGVVWEATVDADGRIALTFLSAYLEGLTGYRPDEVLADPPLQFSRLIPSERPRLLAELQSAVERGGQGTIEFDVCTRDGSPLTIETHYKALRSSNGRVCELRGVALDVSERRRVTEELRRAKEAAESANQLKTVFLANMSHEIRTPLGAVLGFSELLCDSELSLPERERYVEVIARNGQSLSRLIDDILDYSKIESNHMTIERLDLDLADIVGDVLAGLHIKAQAKNIRVQFDVTPVLPARMTSDPVRLRQILGNLVDNAIKFSSEGTIAVSLGYQPPYFTVRVTDRGIGLSDEQVARIFKPFHQADGSTTRKFGGTGLGLALSQRLARLLGGDICLVESVLGEGSVFELKFKDLRPADLFVE